MHKDAGRSIVFIPSSPKRTLPMVEQTPSWGVYEVVSSILFLCLSLLFIGGIAALVIQLIGIDMLPYIVGIDL